MRCRDIAVYRRDNRFFNLQPHAPALRSVHEGGGGVPASPDALPAELISHLAAFVNEPRAEALVRSIGDWSGPIRCPFPALHACTLQTGA